MYSILFNVFNFVASVYNSQFYISCFQLVSKPIFSHGLNEMLLLNLPFKFLRKFIKKMETSIWISREKVIHYKQFTKSDLLSTLKILYKSFFDLKYDCKSSDAIKSNKFPFFIFLIILYFQNLNSLSNCLNCWLDYVVRQEILKTWFS